jgi:hypothetical protein
MEDEGEYLEYYKVVLDIIGASQAPPIISSPGGGKSSPTVYNGKKADPLATVKNDPSFLSKVKQVANSVKCDFTHLLGLMEIETARTFSPSVFNGINHYGLIQFAESYKKVQLYHKKVGDTTKGLTAKLQLTKLNRVEQMDYVEGFLDKWKKANGMGSQTLSPSDLYTLVFLPDYADKPDNYVFATKSNDPLLYWKQNPALRDNSRPDKAIWKGYLGKIILEKSQKYSGL